MNDIVPITRALISVSDKRGLVEFARVLVLRGVEIISTGGTARALKEAGIAVLEVSDYTGFPEMLDGRVKTLHPTIHGGLLFVRGNAEHERVAQEHGIKPIDLVVVNLYPFEETRAKEGISREAIVENIDIGGPSMIRSAAKNHAAVTVVVDPADYVSLSEAISRDGGVSFEMRRTLAGKAFARTAAFDTAVASFFQGEKKEQDVPPTLLLAAPQAQKLRYGENPHQKAGLYGNFSDYYEQLQGKELSYNNLLDLAAASELIEEFENDSEPAIAILKHTNPCGVGQGETLLAAWEKAFATDRQAPFGGIIASSKEMDGETARAISELFSEVIIAPYFSEEARTILSAKKNLRLIVKKKSVSRGHGWQARSVGPQLYVLQESDQHRLSNDDETIVTKRAPTERERAALLFAWRVVKHVKSNAIVFAEADRTLAVGAGQMSRVDSTKIAIWKAAESGLSLTGSVVASDAFFPFPDALLAAADAGATAFIQPGGSVKDADVIAAANGRNLAMVFTGIRHFKH